jgi:isoleucyl-tRNA synthetase
MAFCLEAERFIDEKLSNWYIRRNRRRFWKGEKGKDKDAAYQTLYTVLKTFTQLIAPIVPFLAEVMWRNLRLQGDPESVHLGDYPQADEKLLDAQLSQDMEALFALVTLGSAARNAAKIKVRQPLGEIRVYADSDVIKSALRRFGDQLCDELNIRKAALHEGSALLSIEAKPNRKSLGPKAGARLLEICTSIEKLDTSGGLKFPMELSLPGGPFTLEAADVAVTYRAAEGWTGAAEKGTQVAVDTRLTPDLKRAGMAREVVRFVQDLRKNTGLQMEDRIALCLKTDSSELKQAIDAHRDYIAAETLTTKWADSVDTSFVSAEVKIEGAGLTIALRKV